jgi:hypothetical protein
MTLELQIAIIASASALTGSLIGGLVSYLTTMHSAKAKWRHQQLDKEIDTLMNLHSNFLAEAGRFAFLSLDQEINAAKDFIGLYTLLARVRLLSDKDTVNAAEALAEAVTQRKIDEEPEGDETMSFSALLNEMCRCSRKEIARLRDSGEHNPCALSAITATFRTFSGRFRERNDN